MLDLIDNSDDHDDHAEKKAQLGKAITRLSVYVGKPELTDTEREMRARAVGRQMENRQKL